MHTAAFIMLKFNMSLYLGNIADLTEVVVCDSEPAMQAHRDLFRFSANAYVPVYESGDDASENYRDAFQPVVQLIDTCNAATLCPSRIHIAAGWENILKVAAWRADFASVRDAFIILKNAGLADSTLSPFTRSPVSDIFPYLYYGKRLDVLKKICTLARRQIESRIKKGGVRADCHLINEDSPRIVASSL
jgi:hypothetical protein